ncbi:pyrimidine 5'-nucleotidase (UMPH-1) domain-containing protein [Ditylenchus destructor]|uniref:5'-nucleotidase n=1 Tax=Ditylenchus destructor TaxID=166010 RepID=A0AAD4N1B6_9BILA|nr:pyrimidine 5'-nucleotidase (UMPH-1) domain-containing protein [Ditylenchus destructor]
MDNIYCNTLRCCKIGNSFRKLIGIIWALRLLAARSAYSSHACCRKVRQSASNTQHLSLFHSLSLRRDKRNMAGAKIMTELINNNKVVLMRDPKTVRTKLDALLDAGFDKLIVITDFDYTLSRFTKNGHRCSTTHGVFEQAIAEEDKEFHAEISKLREKYLHIEFSPTMTIEEKTPYMEEWWQTSHKLIVENRFSREKIKEFTAKSQVMLRERAAEFVSFIEKQGSPLIVFSAGIGNIIQFVLEDQLGTVPKCLHILSNMMIFNKEGVCVNFSEPLVHTFNKNSSVVKKDAPFFHQISNRTCVLLLGDSLGDIHMDVGVEKETVVLKVGYLNFNFEQLTEKYLEEYDIVLIDDQTMNVPLTILKGFHEHSTQANEVPSA